MNLKSTFIPALLLLTLACGGSSRGTSPHSPALAYTDPTGTGWRLVRNAASTPDHLVLDLLGPAETKARGVGFELTLGGSGAAWAKVSTQDPQYEANRLFDLGSDPAVQAFRGKARQGTLQVGLYQKGAATALKGPILSLAIDLKAGSASDAATLVPLTVAKAHFLSEDGQITDLKADLQVGKVQYQ